MASARMSGSMDQQRVWPSGSRTSTGDALGLVVGDGASLLGLLLPSLGPRMGFVGRDRTPGESLVLVPATAAS